jgi:hypothetical protein
MKEMSQKYHAKFTKETVPTKATTYRMTETFYAKRSVSGTMKTQNVSKSLELVYKQTASPPTHTHTKAVLHFGSSMWNIQRHSPHSNSILTEMYKITTETRILYCRCFQESVLNYLPEPQFMSLGGFANFKNQLLASSCLSICPPPWINSAPTGQIFMKFDINVVKNL